MKRRKQRVVVEITFHAPKTEKQAAWFARDVFEFARANGMVLIGKVSTKEFGRVLRAISKGC